MPNLFQGQVNFFCEGPLLLAANTALMAVVMASDNPWQVKALVSKYPMAPINNIMIVSRVKVIIGLF